jgi:hypothetical protein
MCRFQLSFSFSVHKQTLIGGTLSALLLLIILNPLQVTAEGIPTGNQLSTSEYRIIGWNDLGMHCMNAQFQHLCILPPFNTLHAQVIHTGAVPQLMVSGVTVEFSFEDNSYSAGKTNFWDWEDKLFGANLPTDYGLAGNTLTGHMAAELTSFVATGIPLTPFRDSAPTTLYPYQIALLIARDSTTGVELARTRPVAPVSTEIRCGACHVDGMEDIATGNVETNILTLHDREEGTNLMGSQPVLCAKCHGSNALGAPGNPELPNLSRAIHHRHASGGDDKDEGTEDCYMCHPGVETQCHRDIMYTKGMRCANCHGTMADVANGSRRPWIDLPRCGATACHGSQFSEEPGELYRNSQGHGGLYCSACHGSPHAIWPSIEANDNIQTIALQGYAGTLSDCRVCHNEIPSGLGPHGITVLQPTPTPTEAPAGIDLDRSVLYR